MLMSLMLLFAGLAHGQMPFHPKFLASGGGPDDSPFLEAQRDALNLHDGEDASVALAAPISINCTARGTEFTATLLQKGQTCSLFPFVIPGSIVIRKQTGLRFRAFPFGPL